MQGVNAIPARWQTTSDHLKIPTPSPLEELPGLRPTLPLLDADPRYDPGRLLQMRNHLIVLSGGVVQVCDGLVQSRLSVPPAGVRLSKLTTRLQSIGVEAELGS